jgi:hypothetical protein
MSYSQESPKPEKRGSIRQGTTIMALGHGLRFDVPTSWVRWYEENETYPNLHLSAPELDLVKETKGEWDQEFALVVNAILPFDQCVAHVGSEGWGPRGMSYADLQVRAYILMTRLEEIEYRARSQGAAVVATFAKTDVVLQQDQAGPWRRTLLKYLLMYHDYGATAIVDLRLQEFGTYTVAFAFMYTDHTNHTMEIEMMLDSVRFTNP